jgi:outer membrane protein OmpA-like peptidoglycan-associated protein
VDDPPPFPDIELLFERGLATLGPDSDDDLARLATFLNTAGGTRWVVVEGVASPDGSAWFNYGLALDRAAYVVKRLVTLGVHPDRLTLRARGELAGGAMARRVDVRWAQTPEISGPGEAPWEREMEEVGP